MLGVFGMSGPWEWVIVLVMVLIFFGVGKLPQVLSQMGKGVKAFKDGVNDDSEEQGKDDAAREIDVKMADADPTASRVSEAEELRS